MELSTLQRIGAFAAVVLALAVLGVYLFLPSAVGAGTSPAARPASPPAVGTTPASGQRTPPGQAAPPGTTSAAPAAGTAGQPIPDIYQWLPFTAAGLRAAARTAVRFGADYGTYSYSESAAAYLAPMRGLISPALAGLLGRAYSAPGLASQRAGRKQVSSGTAVITSLRGFGPTSLVFVLAISQHIADDQGRSQVTTNYAVTLAGAGDSWQVSDIELASAGNA